ncbi:type IV pilus modification protein PilV [Pseudomonas sp. R1-18]|uniref:type IV pilus modification protein PilV n=1 Tax=Pseudomonas sp. R1-18 TaxID=1632772 RepID=UPI003DA878BE
MQKLNSSRQRGMTLIEVLVSVLILAIGLLGAAAIQLNALKYTDSATMSSQASFIAYDMMDRIRANVDGNAVANGTTDVLTTYGLANLAAAPSAGSDARSIDLSDFRNNITNFAGADGAESNIIIDRPIVTITVVWDDARALRSSEGATGAPLAGSKRSFVLSSRIGINP